VRSGQRLPPGKKRRVPQVSLLRPGIRATAPQMETPPSPLSSRAQPRDLQFAPPVTDAAGHKMNRHPDAG
jgi:hypothetical protein